MTHIELSLSPSSGSIVDTEPTGPLAKWARPVVVAEEPCVVVDLGGVIAAASMPWRQLVGMAATVDPVGRHLLDHEVLRLIDFTAAGHSLNESDVDQIPPLLAISSARPARGVLRLKLRAGGHMTLDAVATALRHNGDVVGSLSFFASV